ncbi:addiction module toxin RelE [Citrobacter sp. CFNIH10]|nr:addiction module toxin RelE [Citrobacter sp. CFNIH10]AVC45158.1 addiction module toxin RelE [Citrobacter amalonaticus]AVI00399.1 addiction module toxin RelE [Citrobacter amalonaticus]PNP33681.1 addiction module toxin RelE [Citrobacter amalonaticus]
MRRGGKPGNLQELTEVSDWSEQAQPTKRQLEG